MTFQYLLRRASHSVFLLFLVTLVVFALLHMVPGDPALVLLGGQATTEEIADLRKSMGFDKPLTEQYLAYLSGIMRGDFGTSIRARKPVQEYILDRLPASLKLIGAAMSIAVALGIPIGVLAAVRRNTGTDHFLITTSLLGQSVPSFWLGLMLIGIFAVKLRWLPVGGDGGVVHLLLPSITLSLYLLAFIARLTRASMLEVLSSDYIRTAHAKGLPQLVVLFKHALKNALNPVVTVVGLQVGALLGNTVITETVFAWPGIGSLAVNAVYQRDYPVVQGITFLAAGAFVLINFLIDVAYMYLDPRVGYS